MTLPLAHGHPPAASTAIDSIPPVLRKGFRPFFLGAASFAVLSLVAWVLWLTGLIPAPGSDPFAWHRHEMVFGFTTAVIAGFLLTAVANWTGQETLVGRALLGIFALWVVGRALMPLSGTVPPLLVAGIDAAFLPLLAVVILRPIARTRNRRNYVVGVILLALAAANITTHLDTLGVVPGFGLRASLLGVDLITLLMLLISGRIIPMFTRNATGVGSIRSLPELDKAAGVMMAVLSIAAVFAGHSPFVGLLSVATGLVTAARSRHWGLGPALGDPMLWVLHAGHACIVLGLLLRGLSAFLPSLPPALAMHATTVGGVGLLTLGMMVRVSHGHTGRPIRASRAASWAFGLLLLAVPARVLMPLLVPGATLVFWTASGLLWAAAFTLFLVDTGPKLLQPRADGRPG